jgi:AbrB family looped-hinge helix DNA binding protein
MKVVVTSKGQVTIPKKLRDQFGIERGTCVDFVAAPDGIRVRKVVDRSKRPALFGCLKKELADRSVPQLLDELRGSVSVLAVP